MSRTVPHLRVYLIINIRQNCTNGTGAIDRNALGNYLVGQEDDGHISVHPAVQDPEPSPIGRSLAASQDPNCRVVRPMVRLGYYKDGRASDTSRRGREPFVAVSWDEANAVTNDIGTSSLAQGPSANSCLVEVERYEGDLPPLKVFSLPAIIERQDADSPLILRYELYVGLFQVNRRGSSRPRLLVNVARARGVSLGERDSAASPPSLLKAL